MLEALPLMYAVIKGDLIWGSGLSLSSSFVPLCLCIQSRIRLMPVSLAGEPRAETDESTGTCSSPFCAVLACRVKTGAKILVKESKKKKKKRKTNTEKTGKRFRLFFVQTEIGPCQRAWGWVSRGADCLVGYVSKMAAALERLATKSLPVKIVSTGISLCSLSWWLC